MGGEGAIGAVIESGAGIVANAVAGVAETATPVVAETAGGVVEAAATIGASAAETAAPIAQVVESTTAAMGGSGDIGPQIGETASELARQQVEHTRLLRTGQEADRIIVAGRIGTVRQELDRLMLQRMGVDQPDEQETRIEEPPTLIDRAVGATVAVAKNVAHNVTTDIKTEVANNFEPEGAAEAPVREEEVRETTVNDALTLEPELDKVPAPKPIPQPISPIAQTGAVPLTNLG